MVSNVSIYINNTVNIESEKYFLSTEEFIPARAYCNIKNKNSKKQKIPASAQIPKMVL